MRKTNSLWMLAPLMLISSFTSAEIFKCPLQNGVVRLQNFPCPIDWPDSHAPSSASGAAAPSAPDPTQDKKATAAADQRSGARTAASVGAPQVGMTAEEVKAAWGEPSNVYWDELVDGRTEVWSFSGSRSVQFDLKGRVSGVHR